MKIVENEQRNYFTNLFQVVLSDSQIDPAELNFLYELGIERGFSKEQIDEIIANPHKTRFEKPHSLIQAIELLYDLVQMVLKDGKIHLHEVELCKSFARRFDIEGEIIDELIETLIEQVRAGASKEKIIDEIKQTL